MRALPQRELGARAPSGALRTKGEADAVNLGLNHASFPLTGDETGGTYSLTEFTMAPPPAPGPPPHIHEDADEEVYILEGSLIMGMGERSLTGSVGSVLFRPQGHAALTGQCRDGPARFLVILSPPGYEGFWREIAALRAATGVRRRNGPLPPIAATTPASLVV